MSDKVMIHSFWKDHPIVIKDVELDTHSDTGNSMEKKHLQLVSGMKFPSGALVAGAAAVAGVGALAGGLALAGVSLADARVLS